MRRRGSDVRERYGERRAGAELIEFDPESWYSSVDRWLNKIDQLGRIHYSADYKKTDFMQLKLVGPAKVRFHRCASGAAPQGRRRCPSSEELPLELQANARVFKCRMADELYSGFLADLDVYQERT